MVKPGYKQTEVGIIPNTWQVISLQNLCIQNGIVRGPFGGALKKEIFVAEGYKVYEQGNAIYKTVTRGSYYIDAAKYNKMLRFFCPGGRFHCKLLRNNRDDFSDSDKCTQRYN